MKGFRKLRVGEVIKDSDVYDDYYLGLSNFDKSVGQKFTKLHNTGYRPITYDGVTFHCSIQGDNSMWGCDEVNCVKFIEAKEGKK